MKTKTAVLVVDMVNDFTQPNGCIYYETTAKIVPKTICFLEQMHSRGALIVYITHTCTVKEAEDDLKKNQNLRTCCLEGSGGELLDSRFPRYEDDILIKKRRMSGFFQTDLDNILKKNNIVNVAVVGTKTNCCVRATITDASMRDYRSFLINDCVSTNTVELNRFHCEDIGKYTACSLTATEFIQLYDCGQI